MEMLNLIIFSLILAGDVLLAHPMEHGEACASRPCGQGALCETTPTGLAICKCPENYSGDAFIKCVSKSSTTTMEIPSTTTAFSTSTSNNQKTTSAAASQKFTVHFEMNSEDDVIGKPISGDSLITSLSQKRHDHNYPYRPNNNIGSRIHPITSAGSGSNSNNMNVYPNRVVSNSFVDTIPHGSVYVDRNPNSEGPHLPVASFEIYKHQNPLNLNSPLTKDPMGQYVNCRTMNGIVVCADNSEDNFLKPIVADHQDHRQGIVDGIRDRNTNTNHYNPHQSSNSNYGIRNNFYPDYSSNYSNTEIHSGAGNENVKPIFNAPNHNYGEVIGNLNPHRVTINPSSISSNNNDGCKSMCGEFAICRLINNRPVCGCPEGHTGDPSIRCEPETTKQNESSSIGRCQGHADCNAKEICVKSTCVDPCSDHFQMGNGETTHNGNMCGKMAKCTVVEHTPLCACMEGFFGNPYLACV